jgi:ketosteroid isomerase-like protein
VRRLALVAAVCVAVSGCAEESDEKKVRDVVRHYLTAIAKGDGERACDVMSDREQRDFVTFARVYTSFGGGGCRAAVAHVGRSANSDAVERVQRAAIHDVSIQGDRATARTDDGPERFVLSRSDGAWRVESAVANGWPRFGVPALAVP